MRNMKSVLHRKEAIRGYIQAADLLPDTLWQAAFSIPENLYEKAEEFRLRVGQPLILTVHGVSHRLDSLVVSEEHLEALVAKATRCSMHSYDQQLRQGFVTARGGHRIGLCGVLTETSKGPMLRELTVGIGEAIACYVLGLLLMRALSRLPAFRNSSR